MANIDRPVGLQETAVENDAVVEEVLIACVGGVVPQAEKEERCIAEQVLHRAI
jgi:hypothetical protein